MLKLSAVRAGILSAMLLCTLDVAAQGGGFQTRGLENRSGHPWATVDRPKTTLESALLIGRGLPFAAAPLILPSSQSWVTWWEMNRDRHLNTLAFEALKIKEKNPNDRTEAVRVLTDALNRNSKIASAATLTLGRMGSHEALAELINLTQKKVPESMKLSAWLSLGLMGGDGRGQYLLDQLPGLDQVDTLACITAIGLLDEMPAGGAEALLKYIAPEQNVPEIRRMALWAINEHEPAEHRRLMHDILADSNEPYLVMEALEGLGRVGDTRDVDTLVNYAGASDPSKLVALYTTALKVFSETAKAGLLAPQSPTQRALYAELKGPYTRQLEGIRASAARALGRFDQPADRKQVAEGLGKLDHPFIQQSVLMGKKAQFAFMMSLGMVGQRYAPKTLKAVVDMHPTGHGHSWRTGTTKSSGFKRPKVTNTIGGGLFEEESFIENSHRCYAAISAGLLVRRIDELTADPRARNALEGEAFGPRDLATTRDELLESLIGPLRSTGEYSYTRAACAMGIGLSGDKKQIPKLVEVMGNLRKQDEAIFGYIALSLGMLGDERLPFRLKGYLGPAKKSLDIEGIMKGGMESEYTYEQRMSRRAAVMGLAELGIQEAAPLLIGEWGKDEWVSHEVARALGALKDQTISEDLRVLVYQTQNDLIAEVAAAGLGDLYDAEYPSRLTRLQREYATGNVSGVSRSIPTDGSLRGWLAAESKIANEKGYTSMAKHLHRFGNPLVYRYLNELKRHSRYLNAIKRP